jgi:hypothetical protein
MMVIAGQPPDTHKSVDRDYNLAKNMKRISNQDILNSNQE